MAGGPGGAAEGDEAGVPRGGRGEPDLDVDCVVCGGVAEGDGDRADVMDGDVGVEDGRGGGDGVVFEGSAGDGEDDGAGDVGFGDVGARRVGFCNGCGGRDGKAGQQSCQSGKHCAGFQVQKKESLEDLEGWTRLE